MESRVKLGISLFSLTREIANRKLSFADCLSMARELGISGIEILSTQSIPGYPWPSPDRLSDMRSTCEQSGLELVCYDSFLEHGVRSDRFLNFDELFAGSLNELITASRLGVPLVRLLPTAPVALIEKLLPYAVRWQLKLAVEINHPFRLDSPEMQAFFELYRQVGPSNFGFIFDFDTFTCDERGPSQDMLMAFGDILPWINHYHGKVYALDDLGDDPGIPASILLPLIRESGFDGYVICEFRRQGRSEDDSMRILDRQLSRYRQILLQC